MSHPEQHNFFKDARSLFPKHFISAKVLECGSLNVNGTIRTLFSNCQYTGVDIVKGRDVDIVSAIKDLTFEPDTFDTVVSGEMLEHDETWRESLQTMYGLTRPGGLIAITCAGKDRPEHGTLRTGDIWGTSDNYYMNLTEDHFREIYKDDMFEQVHHEYNPNSKDQYFFGIKS